MFTVLLSKEIKEQIRTSRMLIVVAVLLVFGLVSPLLAKYTPDILRSVPNLPDAIANAIPEPTVVDSVSQYLKNAQQFGILLVILFNMGALAQEKERGTAAMLLSKPVSRGAWVMAKWLAANLVLLLGVLLGGLAFYAYNTYLFEAISLPAFLGMSLLLALYLDVFLTVALMASALSKSQGMAAGFAFGGLVILLVLGAIPRVSDVMPGKLLEWGVGLVLGGAKPAWGALAVSVGLIVLMLAAAIARLSREEI